MKIATMISFGNVVEERIPKVLKLGYFTSLTIIAERKSRTDGSSQPQWPRSFSFSFNLIMKSVSEATRPAADGMGKPRKSLPAPGRFMAERQLKRASRNAPQMR